VNEKRTQRLYGEDRGEGREGRQRDTAPTGDCTTGGAGALVESRPHFRKVAYFVGNFPHALICTEWRVKWPVWVEGRKTYNPDYWCPSLQKYIEVCTSRGNLTEQRAVWEYVIMRRRPILFYWWQGQNVTRNLDRILQLHRKWEKAGKIIP
jgi:hypothetical protein